MRLNFYFWGLGALMLVACEQPTVGNKQAMEEDMMTQAEFKAHIQHLEDTLSMAYNTKDVELFSRFYADNAVTYGEGREQLFGKKEMIRHFRNNVVDSKANPRYEYLTIDVFRNGDLAVENGKWVLYNESNEEIDHGFYMVMFRKKDGKWVSTRDIWNSSTMDHAHNSDTLAAE